jgi:5'-3' exonuclease
MIALIDGDLVAYRCSSSCEPTKAKPEREPLEAAIGRTHDLINRILNETGATSFRLFIGGETNFRTTIDPNYKANRKDLPRPTYLQDIRALLCTDYDAEITDGIEADDAMAINQRADTIICSIDKDLLQVPGRHFNFVKNVWYGIDKLTGLKNFYQQLIQGDATDNIMGYDGKARPKIPQFLQPKIDELWSMDNEWDMYRLVLQMYDMDYERLLRNARLLYIQRKENDEWNFPQKP